MKEQNYKIFNLNEEIQKTNGDESNGIWRDTGLKMDVPAGSVWLTMRVCGLIQSLAGNPVTDHVSLLARLYNVTADEPVLNSDVNVVSLKGTSSVTVEDHKPMIGSIEIRVPYFAKNDGETLRLEYFYHSQTCNIRYELRISNNQAGATPTFIGYERMLGYI